MATTKKTSATKTAPKPAEPYSLGAGLVNALDTNDRITRYLIEQLPAEAWRAEPPGGKGRDIAAIVSHVHNVRVMWLKAAKATTVPEQLDRHTVTQHQALDALGESQAALRRVVEDAVAGNGQVKGFKPDVAGFVGYHIAHEAHHRGQITMLARQLGRPVSQKTMFGMWEWGSRSRDVTNEK